MDETVGDPVDVLFDRLGHVRQNRRTLGPGDREQIREPGDAKAEVGLGAIGPLLLECDSIPALDIDLEQGAGHRIESRGEDENIQLVGVLGRLDSRRRDSLDGSSFDVDELDVVPVVGLVVAVVVHGRALGRIWVVGRNQQLGDLGIIDALADLLTDERRDRRVERFIDEE
ncbi:MAG: hypothetical protein U5K37_02335 [Natrialbaceae archaeon]|nr:hypothetical protein [Natrialbaceae archaeon]